MLAKFFRFSQNTRIKSDPSAGTEPRNPYRRILHRDYPEPLVALLAFIFGIWLWDQYFGETMGYTPGTTEVAMLKIDRDLRLADAMDADPAWLRWLAGVETPAEVRRNARAIFLKLGMDKSLDQSAIEAYAVIHSLDEKKPVLEGVSEILGPKAVPNFSKIEEAVEQNQGGWWHAQILDARDENPATDSSWRNAYDKTLNRLRTRAIAIRSTIWLLGLAGLAFLPQTLRCLAGALRAKPKGYSAAWRPTLGMTVFFVATLAWIGFTTMINLGIIVADGLPTLLATCVDSGARLLPAMIALCLLFKRPSHAARVLGAQRPVFPAIVLGLFALLLLIDQLLLRLLGNSGTVNPGGGLSLAEAGIDGLVYSIVSACLVAPFAEEILYRGVLFRSLANRVTVLPAALISATAFALVHFYNLYGLISVGIFGFACALLYSATGSLTSVIALHLLYNASVKIPQWIVYHAPTGGFFDR